jgi:hypothetical protein
LQFYLADFFGLRSSYSDKPIGLHVDSLGVVDVEMEYVSPSDTTVVSVRIGDYEKRVSRLQWGPPSLLQVEKAILAAAADARNE